MKLFRIGDSSMSRYVPLCDIDYVRRFIEDESKRVGSNAQLASHRHGLFPAPCLEKLA